MMDKLLQIKCLYFYYDCNKKEMPYLLIYSQQLLNAQKRKKTNNVQLANQQFRKKITCYSQDLWANIGCLIMCLLIVHKQYTNVIKYKNKIISNAT